MNFLVYIEQMIENLLTAKLRSFLAVLGILVGTASVVALVSGGEIATQNALIEFKELGTNLLAVTISQANNKATSDQSDYDNLTVDEANKLPAVVPSVDEAAPYSSLFLPLNFQGHNVNGGVVGATKSLKDIVAIKLASGRFVSSLDKEQEYCVVGKNIAQSLLNYGVIGGLIGKQLAIGGNVFTIVGVAKQWPENSFMYEDINNSIIVPLQASLVMSKYAKINNIIFRLRTHSDIELVKQQITTAINQMAANKRLFYRSSQEIIKSMDKQHRTFTWLLGFIGSISLIVGGIGVMNIMLVSVTERHREIGIRRALGARSKDIQFMFLVESMGLTIFGGVLGVICGILISYLIADFAHWQFFVFPTPPLIGFAVSVFTGVFFGFYPARKASKLDPIEALRSE